MAKAILSARDGAEIKAQGAHLLPDRHLKKISLLRTSSMLHRKTTPRAWNILCSRSRLAIGVCGRMSATA